MSELSSPTHNQQKSANDDLWETIGKSVRLNTVDLTPHIPHVLPGNRMAGAWALSTEEGVQQHVIGAVKAGDETFAIVSAIDHRKSQGDPEVVHIITRTHPDTRERAEIAGVIPSDGEVLIGRADRPEFAGNVSRSHFRVAVSPDGKVGVTDLDSTNGTQVVEPADTSKMLAEFQQAQDSNLATEGLFRALKRRSAAAKSLKKLEALEAMEDTNPFEDHKLWSARSAAVRMAVDSVKPKI